MIGRDGWIYPVGVSAESWAKRYGIEPFSTTCYTCGAMLESTVPFAKGTLRGLTSPPCACGNLNPPYCVVRVWWAGDLF